MNQVGHRETRKRSESEAEALRGERKRQRPQATDTEENAGRRRKRGPCKGRGARAGVDPEDCCESVSIPVSFSGFTVLHLDNCTVKRRFRKRPEDG